MASMGGSRARRCQRPRPYRELLDPSVVPARFLRALDRFDWDYATIKVDWALSRRSRGRNRDRGMPGRCTSASPWKGSSTSPLTSTRRMPRKPFVLLGQMTTADATRSPAGTESAWAYTHVPRDMNWTPELVEEHVRRIEQAVEVVAPGFTSTQLARHVQSPVDLERADANLVGGAINGGTAGLHQQLFMRPTTGLGRPETPIPGLFLASASAHPGGGVHGACGWNAARAAISANGRAGALHRALVRTAWARVLSGR
jgi:phytoene dehydrogenase-like protein